MSAKKNKKSSPSRTEADPAYQTNPLVYVDASNIHGYGLFAMTDIKKGQHIGTYRGPYSKKNGMHVLWVWDENSDSWFGIDGRNEMRFANHSDTPNAEFWGDEMYALRAIQKDEEITFNYQWDDFDEDL